MMMMVVGCALWCVCIYLCGGGTHYYHQHDKSQFFVIISACRRIAGLFAFAGNNPNSNVIFSSAPQNY